MFEHLFERYHGASFKQRILSGLTHFLCHAHLHVFLLEVLHGLEGLLRIHLLIHRLHRLNTQNSSETWDGLIHMMT